MVTTRRAFDAADPATLATQIQYEMPPSPSSLNQRIQLGVSDLIMKALAKDPEARYQTARELVADLEKCKDSGKKAASETKKPSATSNVVVNPEARSAAASKFVSSSPTSAEPELQTFSQPHSEAPQPKAHAAAAGAGESGRPGRSSFTSGGGMIEQPELQVPKMPSAATPVMSAATAEPETETHAPHIAVDPMMAGGAQAKPAKSFSDLDELPPLKEVSYAPPPPPPALQSPELPAVQIFPKPEQKPKVHPREAAQKAVLEIKTIPPQLMMYSILGAVALILIVTVALFFHVRSVDDDSTAAPRPTRAAAPEPAPAPQPATPAPVSQAPPAATVVEPEPQAAPEPEVTVRQSERRAPKAARRAVPSVIPGSIQVDSNPQGAQIQIDGKSDPSWITPFNLTGMAPGKHVLIASKTGYLAETRSVDVTAASKSFVVVQLPPSNALLVVNSNPAGAEIVLDGKSTGRATPAQFAVERGSHTVLLRKAGYLEETTTATLTAGQNFQFGPALRPLGNADDIRSVGKFKKLFGKGGDSAADMGSVMIRTQPKGAQLALNQHLLDRNSPIEFMVGPGNYVLDITLTGYKPVHKIITVDRGSKIVVDEALERE
jgi:hypothetical protein